MDGRRPYPAIRVAARASCPRCGTRRLAVNLRRVMLWAPGVEEYLLALAVLLRAR